MKIVNSVLLMSLFCVMSAATSTSAPAAEGQGVGGFGIVRTAAQIEGLGLHAQATGTEDQFNVQVFPILGPLKESPEWQPWADQTIAFLAANRTISDLGYLLQTSYFVQPAAKNARTLWFVVRITSKNPATMFNINMLHLSEASTDRDNVLKSDYNLVGGNYNYTTVATGYIWSNGFDDGDRSNDQKLDSGSGATMVHELNFIGIQSPWFGYGTPAQLASIDDYRRTENMSVIGTVMVVGPSNNVLATGSRTLQSTGTPANPRLTIRTASNGTIVVGYVADPNRSVNIWSRPQVATGSWSLEATVNTGDEIVRSKVGSARFYRALLQ